MNYQNNWLQNYLILLQNQNPIASANSSLQSGFPFPLVLMNNILTDPNQFAFNHNILTDQNQFAFNQNNLILNHLSANLQRNNQLQGGGDGFGAYSSHIAVNELSCSNIHPSNSLAMLSPPAESIKEAFRDLPIKSSLSYNDRIHESINYFFSTQKRLMLESESNLSSPKYDALNSHGVPYGSSLEKFQLFKDLDFNFAIPEKVRIFKQPHYLSSEEYKAIREDFASNGVIVSDIDECNPVLSPIGFFADSDFPLMELTSDDFRKFPATEVTSLPMQHSNTSIGSSSTDRLKKKRCKTDKKTSDDVSSTKPLNLLLLV